MDDQLVLVEQAPGVVGVEFRVLGDLDGLNVSEADLAMAKTERGNNAERTGQIEFPDHPLGSEGPGGT